MKATNGLSIMLIHLHRKLVHKRKECWFWQTKRKKYLQDRIDEVEKIIEQSYSLKSHADEVMLVFTMPDWIATELAYKDMYNFGMPLISLK